MSIASWIKRFRSTASGKPVSRTDDPTGLGGMVMTTRAALPVPTVEQSMDALIARMRERGLLSDGFKASPVAASAPLHPLAPEKDPPPLDWDRWSGMQRQTFRRGWSFARFAVRSPEHMACLFGIVRGAWGIAVMDFYVCGTGGSAPLNAITHLPSGIGCGLFVDQESAAVACELTERLADDWQTLDLSSDAMRRLQAAWSAAGLVRCASHAHATADTSTAPLPIWFQDYSTVIAGKPEGKLS